MVQWINDSVCLFGGDGSITSPAQRVKDLGLLHLWLRVRSLAQEVPCAMGGVAKKPKGSSSCCLLTTKESSNRI